MTERTEQLLAMACNQPSASAGEKQLAEIIEVLRSLDRSEIRYRFESKEIGDLVEYVLFEETLD